MLYREDSLTGHAAVSAGRPDLPKPQTEDDDSFQFGAEHWGRPATSARRPIDRLKLASQNDTEWDLSYCLGARKLRTAIAILLRTARAFLLLFVVQPPFEAARITFSIVAGGDGTTSKFSAAKAWSSDGGGDGGGGGKGVAGADVAVGSPVFMPPPRNALIATNVCFTLLQCALDADLRLSFS